MKKILIGLGVVVAIVVGAVAFLVGNLDSLIKQAVEDVGTRATGSEVSLANVEVSLGDGSGALSGLRVANPSGFKSDYAFDLGGISVTLDTNTVTQDPVVIREVVIDDPKLIYELVNGSSNIEAIQNNVDAFSKSLGSDGTSSSSSSSEGPKLIIEDLYIKGGDIRVVAGFLGDKGVGTGLPEIHLQDIGKDDGGATPAEVASKVISSLTDQISGAVAGLDLEGMMKDVEGAAKSAAEAATKAAEDAAGVAADQATGEASKAVDDATKGIGESLDNLLGN